MKKTLTIALLVVFVVMMATTVVNATATDDLVAFLSQTFNIAGKNVSLSAADKVKVERYLQDNPVTEAETNAIKAKVNEAVAYMDQIGVSDPTKLTDAQKNKVIALANEAAGVIGLTVSYDSSDKVVGVYKDGKLVESTTLSSDKLVQTGGINVAYIIVPAVAIIAIAAVVVAKKVNE